MRLRRTLWSSSLSFLLLIACATPLFAAWASIAPSPYPYNPGDSITVYWNAGADDPSEYWCEIPNEYYYYVYASGDDGFVGSDENTWGDGEWPDDYADTSYPHSWN